MTRKKPRNFKSQHATRGFTLIEVITVVGVLGILATIAIPMYHNYRERANNSQAIADIYHLLLFQNQFYNENSEYVPIVVGDKQASGLIRKNITLSNGNTAIFEVQNLAIDVQVAVTTDANKQTIVVGGRHVGSTVAIAADLDAGDGYHSLTLSGAFSAATLPDATFSNDLTSWPIYQK